MEIIFNVLLYCTSSLGGESSSLLRLPPNYKSLRGKPGLPPTWVGERPRAVNEANVRRQADSEDSVGECDQPAAPLIASVLIHVAARNVEGEPASQAAQHLQTQG